MVAVNWNAVSFAVPATLVGYRFEPGAVSSPNRVIDVRERSGAGAEPRTLVSADRLGPTIQSVEHFAQEACDEIYHVSCESLACKIFAIENGSSRYELIEHYNQVVLAATQMQREWTQFLKRCWLYDEFGTIAGKSRSEIAGAKELRKRWLEDGMKHSVFTPVGLNSIVTAEFVSRYSDNLRPHLVDAALRIPQEFTQACVQQLIEMVGLLSVGIATWYPGNTCCYHFFRRHVSGQVGRVRPVQGAVNCHRHDLMDAFVCHPSNAPVEIPDGVRRLILGAPAWLQSQLKLIVGTIIREEISQQNLNDTYWQSLGVIPHIHCDPALIIGNFVLSGWGPSDQQHFQQSREPESNVMKCMVRLSQRFLRG